MNKNRISGLPNRLEILANRLCGLPNGYGGLPNGYGSLSNSYGSLSNSYGSLPNGYGGLPNGYGSLPNGYGSLSNGYGSLSNGYGSLPNGYGGLSNIKINNDYQNMQKLKNNELNRISIDEFKTAKKTPIIVVLDNIRSLNNIGSVFRTSDAFLIEKIYLCGITATPPNKEIHKTALGATESVDWEYAEDTMTIIEKLKTERMKILAIEQAKNSVKLNAFVPKTNQKYAIVMGNEVKGVQQEVVDASDLCIEIPQIGTKHSLNISVSCGVVLWDLFQKMLNS